MSWANAFNSLQNALAAASSGDQIWVAEGTYYPDEGSGQTNDNRSATFQLKNGVAIYGGFAGGGTEVLADRDWATNPTILSGDINQSGNLTGNSRSGVVTGSGTGATAFLDGFTVTGGNSDDGAGSASDGGGGMFIQNGSPTLTNVIFSGNSAFSIGSGGGGMYNSGGSPTLTNVIFSGNSVRGGGGGGMFNQSGSPTLTNVIFSGNRADAGGGMANANSSSPTLTNVTFSGNRADAGGGMFNSQSTSTPTLTNVILWGNTAPTGPQIFNSSSANPTISYSLIQGSGGSGGSWATALGTDGGNNLDADPLFVDAAGGDYSLMNTSPAINAGDPATNLSLFPGGPDNPEDLAGNPRVFEGILQIIDKGAYEFQGNVFGVVVPGDGNIVYVDQNVDTGVAGYSASGNSWDDAIPELRDALGWAQGEWDGSDAPLQIWVADGTYLPTDATTDRNATFQLVDNVEIYGGFAGGEGSLGARDWTANPTILSGDINQSGNLTGNSLTVVTGSGTDATAFLDGFTVTGGNNDDPLSDGGGGMYNNGGSPSLTNVIFSGNNSDTAGGGGMANSGSSPTLTNVTFSGNSAAGGGGMFNQASSPVLTNVTFSANSAADSGGGMYNSGSSPVLTNVTFSGNSATENGGGMHNADSSTPTLTNVILWGNTAPNGPEIDNNSSTPVISYSLIQGSGGSGSWDTDLGTDGGNNIDADPLFVDAAGGDYRLTEFSPAINAGSNAPFEPGGVAEGITTDLDGNDRIFGDTVDMGAYEFGAEPGVVPGGEDRRVLVSNAAAFYTITAGDLSVDDAVSAVKIETLAGGGTLQQDGAIVTNADLPLTIVSGDISCGKLTWTPDAGEYGYGYASLSFRLVNSVNVESADEATLYIDLAATSVAFTDAAGAGWRFVTSPATGETIESLLGPLWTQGFPGSDNPGASFANVQKLDQENYEWDPNVNATDEFTRGLGLIVYAYEDVDGAGGGFPLTLTSGQQWTSLSDEFDFSDLFLSGGGDVGPTFYLFANPHPIALDFCEFSSENIAMSAYFWDPSANGGNGDYITRSCAVDPDETVPIAPFQAFWVLTSGLNPSLSIPEAAYLETTTNGYFKEVENGLIASATTDGNTAQAGQEASAGVSGADGYAITLNVTSRDGIFTNTSHLLFGGEAIPELDNWDAPKLSPEGLASHWLSFYSLDEDGRSYAIQSLPTLLEDQTRIPLDIQTTEAGTFTLNWTLPESHQISAGYFLRDNQSGDVIELKEGNTYSFEVSPEQVHKTTDEVNEPTTINLEHQTANPQNEPRFELLITTDGSDGFAGLGDLPETFTLNQNYPNPFNPTTIISYELPQASQVRLEVYDMAGRQVATLVSGQVAAGRHTVNFDASNLSSGVYLYRLQAGSSLQTRKLTILK